MKIILSKPSNYFRRNGKTVIKYFSLLLIISVALALRTDSDSDTAAGWKKYEGSPLLGGKFGTIFDITVLKEKNKYKMWSSWRPQKSIALSESTDGFHWTDPVKVLEPNANNDWESDLNRPGVIKKDGIYHMWYTGQAKGHSWIGYATSNDGKTWKRMSNNPVISPEVPWEKTSVELNLR